MLIDKSPSKMTMHSLINSSFPALQRFLYEGLLGLEIEHECGLPCQKKPCRLLLIESPVLSASGWNRTIVTFIAEHLLLSLSTMRWRKKTCTNPDRFEVSTNRLHRRACCFHIHHWLLLLQLLDSLREHGVATLMISRALWCLLSCHSSLLCFKKSCTNSI